MKTIPVKITEEDYQSLMEMARESDLTSVEALLLYWIEDIAADHRGEPVGA